MTIAGEEQIIAESTLVPKLSTRNFGQSSRKLVEKGGSSNVNVSGDYLGSQVNSSLQNIMLGEKFIPRTKSKDNESMGSSRSSRF